MALYLSTVNADDDRDIVACTVEPRLLPILISTLDKSKMLATGYEGIPELVLM